MGWGALAAAAIGAAGSIYSSSKKSSTTNTPSDTFNAYGQVNTPIQGAINSRDSIYSTLNSSPFQNEAQGLAGNYTNALSSAANGPAQQAVSQYGSDELSGKYLNSPQVNDYATAAGNQINAQAADNQARLASSYARAGMGFSTGQLQGLQSARTSAAAQAAQTRAGLIASNYQNERALQQSSTGIVSGAQQQQLSNLGAAANSVYAPLQSQAGLTTGLLGNQQVQAPTMVQNPSLGGAVANGVSTGAGLYSLYKSYQPANNVNDDTLPVTAGTPGGGTINGSGWVF